MSEKTRGSRARRRSALPGVGLPPAPRSRELVAALGAARKGGEVALRHMGSPDFELKSDHSLVTAADREVEAVVREVLSGATPGIPILGEESATEEATKQAAERDTWVVDPIDGTASYAVSLPTFAVSIGLLHKGEPALGVLYLPRTNEVYAIDKSGPARWGAREVRGVATPESVLESSFLCATSHAHRNYELKFPGKIRCLGSTALHAALVARGAAIGAILQAHVWDVAAVAPMLRRSGGELDEIESGEPLSFPDWLRTGSTARELLACSPESLAALRRFVVFR
ncbi:inositol monophosphatase [bacterium]|nr:inositol monophosphatase [bacterium]